MLDDKEGIMGKYLFEATYAPGGAQGLLKEGGVSRRATIDKMVKDIGGTMEAFYFAFGDTDVFVIMDLPDDASATALALTIGATGTVKIRTTVLITPETVDDAIKKPVNYRPAGQ